MFPRFNGINDLRLVPMKSTAVPWEMHTQSQRIPIARGLGSLKTNTYWAKSVDTFLNSFCLADMGISIYI